ncbi:MAG: FAD:protein FMN transferase, partial [Actinomycetota bacterium]
MYLAERRTRAMGSSAQVLVYANAQAAADRLADLALMRAELLEQCWSRFRDDSELSRLNDNAGLGPVAVSADLETLVAIMREASEWTRGAFDPTILRAIRSLGYDADFAAIVARETLSALDESVSPSLGMCGVVIDTVAHTVSLPAGVGLDPGAIGKGL